MLLEFTSKKLGLIFASVVKQKVQKMFYCKEAYSTALTNALNGNATSPTAPSHSNGNTTKNNVKTICEKRKNRHCKMLAVKKKTGRQNSGYKLKTQEERKKRKAIVQYNEVTRMLDDDGSSNISYDEKRVMISLYFRSILGAPPHKEW